MGTIGAILEISAKGGKCCETFRSIVRLTAAHCVHEILTQKGRDAELCQQFNEACFHGSCIDSLTEIVDYALVAVSENDGLRRYSNTFSRVDGGTFLQFGVRTSG